MLLKKLSCREQFVAIFLGQISHCDSLREIVDLIKFHSNQHYHLGIKKDIARSTLAKANETGDWHLIWCRTLPPLHHRRSSAHLLKLPLSPNSFADGYKLTSITFGSAVRFVKISLTPVAYREILFGHLKVLLEFMNGEFLRLREQNIYKF